MKEQTSIDQRVVAAIFMKYTQTKKALETNNFNQTGIIQETSVDYAKEKVTTVNLKNYEKHVKIVDTVLALLPKNEYSYIVRTFLTKSNKNWWKNHYHPHEYEKLQKTAINRFLYLYLV
ncbi:MG284/MPN403 family protein [Spiroplasma endosymbiont of Virgichneumon dumeticola]|uniref:MG284/MPN403 family protein n=1 Tax=Spiroplasma endosymbiont of Virgichneumon dumeticola TaxID=3139323 RepID=UPI0035C91426